MVNWRELVGDEDISDPERQSWLLLYDGECVWRLDGYGCKK